MKRGAAPGDEIGPLRGGLRRPPGATACAGGGQGGDPHRLPRGGALRGPHGAHCRPAPARDARRKGVCGFRGPLRRAAARFPIATQSAGRPLPSHLDSPAVALALAGLARAALRLHAVTRKGVSQRGLSWRSARSALGCVGPSRASGLSFPQARARADRRPRSASRALESRDGARFQVRWARVPVQQAGEGKRAPSDVQRRRPALCPTAKDAPQIATPAPVCGGEGRGRCDPRSGEWRYSGRP